MRLSRLEAATDLAAFREVEREVLGKRSQLARLHTRLGAAEPGRAAPGRRADQRGPGPPRGAGPFTGTGLGGKRPEGAAGQ